VITRMIRTIVPLALLAAGCPQNSTPPVITVFKATPATIHAGQKSTLSWSVTGATSLSIDQGVGAQTGTSVDVTPTATTTYTLNATGLGGSVTSAATVTVLPAIPAPVITAFAASPSAVVSGGSVTLSWTVTGQIDAIKVDPGAINVLADTNATTGVGSHVITGVSPPVTFTLTATNSGGSATATASVALSTGTQHLQYTDPTSITAKLKLVRNASSTNTHLILDMKVGAAAVTAFGVALNIPFDPASAGMIIVPASSITAGAINFGSSPPTAAALLGGAAMPGIYSVGVATKKLAPSDGDVTWAASATLFSISFDMTSAATAPSNVFTAAALATNPKFRAAALKKDGTEAVSRVDIAIGDLIISN
jgi:hypothetical protein